MRYQRAALAAMCFTPLAQANVIYGQTTTSDSAQVGLGWYSSSEPRPTRSFRHADNFVLGGDETIGTVRWWGLSEGLSHTDLSNFDVFKIEFYTNRTLPNGNIRPMSLIGSESFDLGMTNATATGRSAPSGALEYMHEVDLGEQVALTGGETYWISISVRSIDPDADVWQWQDSEDYDTLSSSFDYNQNRWVVLQDTDSAFELISVPAPGTIVAMSGVALLCQRRRISVR